MNKQQTKALQSINDVFVEAKGDKGLTRALIGHRVMYFEHWYPINKMKVKDACLYVKQLEKVKVKLTAMEIQSACLNKVLETGHKLVNV